MSLVDPTIVQRIAHLARLQFTSDEVAAYGEELAKILEYVAILEELPEDAAGMQDEAEYTPQRGDQVVNPADPETTLANAPDQHGSYFRVPVVIHDES